MPLPCLARALSWVHRQLPSCFVCPPMVDGVEELSKRLPYEGSILTSQRPHLLTPNTITLGVEFQYVDLGERKTFSP